jgi:nickel-type superoxide dismutase maturation protease
MPVLLRSKFPGRKARTEVADQGDLDHSTQLLLRGSVPRRARGFVVVVVALAGIGRLAGLRRVVVVGPSMAPTLSEGDRLLVRRVRQLRPDDLVVFPSPVDGLVLVKRIAALAPGEVTVIGDNEGASTDSRHFGSVPSDSVRGVAVYRYSPNPARLPRGRR